MLGRRVPACPRRARARTHAPRLRRLGVIAAVLGIFAALAPAASADITGGVTSGAGGRSTTSACSAVDATGATAGSDYTDPAGNYSLDIYLAAGFPLTLTLHLRRSVPAVRDAPALTAAQAGGGRRRRLAAIALPAREFCAAARTASAAPPSPPTAYVDPAGGRVLSRAGGIAYLRLRDPVDATGLTVLYNGVPIGGAAAAGSGLQRPDHGARGRRLRVAHRDLRDQRRAALAHARHARRDRHDQRPARHAPSGVDVEVVIDISGSMSGTDPQFLRKDAMRALLGLVGKNDRLGAVGFDDEVRARLRPAAGLRRQQRRARHARRPAHPQPRRHRLQRRASRKGYEGLTLPGGLRPGAPQVRDLPDRRRAQRGDYDNAHLLIAANPTGRPWPVCAVQLGKEFQPDGRRAAQADRRRRPAASTRRHRRTPRSPTPSAAAWAPRRTSARSSTRTVNFKTLGKAKTLTKKLGRQDQRREVLRQLHARAASSSRC